MSKDTIANATPTATPLTITSDVLSYNILSVLMKMMPGLMYICLMTTA